MAFRYGNFDALFKKSDIITEDIVDEKIATALEASASTFDDTKILESVDAFPRPGITDVLYIDQSTGYQYIWNGSDYEPVQEALSELEIRDIVR